MREKYSNGSERHRAGAQQAEDRRKASAGSSRMDAVTCRVLREPQHLRAVAEERAASFGGVEGRAGVKHGQMRHELDRRRPFLDGQYSDALEKVVIGEAGRESEDVRVHAPVYHGEFRGSERARAGVRSVGSNPFLRKRPGMRGSRARGLDAFLPPSSMRARVGAASNVQNCGSETSAARKYLSEARARSGSQLLPSALPALN